MERNTFIASLAAFMIVPFVDQANKTGYKRVKKGFKVENNKDRFDDALTLMEGDTFYTKISTKDTDGDMFAFESTRLVKGGPPLHYHYEQDEWFYILSGEFLLKSGKKLLQQKPVTASLDPEWYPTLSPKPMKEKRKCSFFTSLLVEWKPILNP